jgi:hypothetical protein
MLRLGRGCRLPMLKRCFSASQRLDLIEEQFMAAKDRMIHVLEEEGLTSMRVDYETDKLRASVRVTKCRVKNFTRAVINRAVWDPVAPKNLTR